MPLLMSVMILFKSSRNICEIFPLKVVNIHQSLDNNLSSVKYKESACFSSIKFDKLFPVSCIQVNNILHSLNSTYCKLELLSTVILKKCSLSAFSAITRIINSSLSSAQVSLEQWFLNFFVCFTLLTKMIIRFTPNI